MYLEKLEIQGFKSFARPVELLFNRELTSIVGPNGSGKSNIADAVRWVLGEQSIKTLRGKKSEDVIFAGSDKKARLGFAQVDLHLNNFDKQAEVDYDQIIVTRKITRSGESEYLINNNKVRLLDVQLLLAKANFGQKTYSVIGQGMIDSILTSSGSERKEFFDEATGVKQFQIKKEQSINKLENSKENLSQTAQILGELEPRLRSLTRQVKRLEKREKVEIELKELQTNYYSFLHNTLSKELAQVQVDFKNKKEELAGLNQELISLQTELDKEEKAVSRQESFELLQNKLTQVQSELNSLLKEKTILEGKADLNLVSAGKSEVVWLKKQISNLTNDISRQSLLQEEKNHALSSAQHELQILEERRQQILAEFAKLEKNLSGEGDLSIGDISQNLDNLLGQQRDLEQAIEHFNNLEEVNKIKDLCHQISVNLGDLSDKVRRSKNKDKNIWQQEFNKLLASKDNLVSEIAEAKSKVMVLSSEIKQISESIAKDQEELKKTERNVEQVGGQGDFGEQVKELLSKIEEKNKELKSAEEKIKEFNVHEHQKKQVMVEAQKKFRELQHNFNVKNNELNEVKVALARLETRQEDLQKEIAEEIPNLEIKKSAHDNNPAESKIRINNLKEQLQVIGGIDQAVVSEYQEVSDRFEFLNGQSKDLNEAIKHLEKIIKDLDDSIAHQFDESFKNINKLFDKYFKKLFSGGKAELILNIIETEESDEADLDLDEDNDDDEDDEDEEAEKIKPVAKEKRILRSYGIDIKASPPGKRVSSINMLSGGEKALTSIALICAIIANNPSPFVVLDEVDAALDEANSIRFGEIIDELSSKTQFIAITHNRATMHKAKIIYGVTMGDDSISALLSVSFSEADKIAA